MTKAKATGRPAKKAAPKRANAKPAARGPTMSPVEMQEFDLLLNSLRAHKRLLETTDENAPLPPGVTHVLVLNKDEDQPRLIEKRKSFF